MPKRFAKQTNLLARRFTRTPTIGASPGLIVDQVGGTLQAAWSTRKVVTSYNGSALRVRRSSDNSELDIGFDASGNLNTTTLLAHVGANQGYVVTWYDQSGNGNNVTQSTALAQPQIVVGGSIHAINGKAAVLFDGLSTSLPRANATLNAYVINSVSSPSAFGAVNSIARQLNGTSGVPWYLRIDASGQLLFVKDVLGLITTSAIPLAPMVATGVRTDGTNSNLYLNGSVPPLASTAAPMSTASTVGNFSIGQHPGGGQNYNGYIAEIMIYSSDFTTTQRQTLERNQGTYFGITVA